MVSVATLSRHLFSLFNLATGSGDVRLDVAYKNKVYRITIEKTKIDYQEYLNEALGRRRKYKKRMPAVPLNVKACTNCFALMVNGICLRAGCINALTPRLRPKKPSPWAIPSNAREESSPPLSTDKASDAGS